MTRETGDEGGGAAPGGGHGTPAGGAGSTEEPSSGGWTPDEGGGAGDADEEALPALPARVVELFVAPARLFDRLRERPAWLGALLLALGASILSVWLVPEEVMREFLRSQVPADAPQEAAQRQVDFGYSARFVFPLVFTLLGTLITAGVLLFVFNLVLGGEARFKQLFAATSHASVIPALAGLALVPLRLQTGSLETSLNLRLLVPGMEEGFLYYFLQGMDVFALWGAVALGIGVSRIYRHDSATSGISVVVGLYVAVAALGAAARAIGAG